MINSFDDKKELAEKLGVSFQAVYLWVDGTNNISRSALKLLEIAYKELE